VFGWRKLSRTTVGVSSLEAQATGTRERRWLGRGGDTILPGATDGLAKPGFERTATHLVSPKPS
jgi:hypothetical protein